MNEPKSPLQTPAGPLDVPGAPMRTTSLGRGKIRLLVFGVVILVMVIIGLLHPKDKPIQPSHAVLRPGDGGMQVYSNTESGVSFPVPAGWVLAAEQKADQAHLQDPADACRAVLMRMDFSGSPDSFQLGMGKKMQADGNRTTPQPATTIDGRHAARMRADLPKSGAVEDVYTVQSRSSAYTMVLVSMPGCTADLTAMAQGLKLPR